MIYIHEKGEEVEKKNMTMTTYMHYRTDDEDKALELSRRQQKQNYNTTCKWIECSRFAMLHLHETVRIYV